MTIQVGIQLYAPDGFEHLEANVTYYFLSSTPHRVLLVQFILGEPRVVKHNSKTRPSKKMTPEPRAKLVALERKRFEYGLTEILIIEKDNQKTLPPWLDGLENLDLGQIDVIRQGRTRKPKKTHRQRIDEKVFAIHPLVDRYEQILSLANPDKELNAHARNQSPKKNEGRLRLWFYVYVLFGKNREALYYPIHVIGNWDRLELETNAKLGRPAKEGRRNGFNSDRDMREKIIKGFVRESDIGLSWDKIYVEQMIKDFGVHRRSRIINGQEVSELWHPQGLPFPRIGAWRYHVEKAFSRKEIATTLVGKVRVRETMAPFRGTYTEHTFNLMQRVEADGHAMEELPRGVIEGSTLSPLYEVIRRDTTSGIKTGIGFSQGSETAQAYAEASFCEAVDKVWWCLLQGVKITAIRWPSIGLSPYDIRDRGPGSSPRADAREEEFTPVIDELARAQDGQGKAVVESSHPRTKSNDEVSTFVQSEMRPYELMRRQIYELIRFNESANVPDRVPLDLINLIGIPTPNNIYSVLAARGRTSAVQISKEQAVRNFLPVRKAVIQRGGVEFIGRLFKSQEFEKCGALVSGNYGRTVNIYCTSTVRTIWIDWEGQLILLNLALPVPARGGMIYLTLEELDQIVQYCDARGEPLDEHRLAVMLGIRREHSEAAGMKWHTAKLQHGKPKRGTPVAKREAAEAKADVAGKQAA